MFSTKKPQSRRLPTTGTNIDPKMKTLHSLLNKYVNKIEDEGASTESTVLTFGCSCL